MGVVSVTAAFFKVFCDCGSSTDVVVSPPDAETKVDTYEFAITCDDCLRVRWITMSGLLGLRRSLIVDG